MLGDITAADEIYIVTGRTDMRKSIDGLCAIVEDQLHMDPRRSALYLFCGKRCDRIKALLWESDGFVLLYKRMEVQGRFRWPRNRPGSNSTGSCPGLKSNNPRHSNLRNDRVNGGASHPVSCLKSLVNAGVSASFSLLFMV